MPATSSSSKTSGGKKKRTVKKAATKKTPAKKRATSPKKKTTTTRKKKTTTKKPAAKKRTKKSPVSPVENVEDIAFSQKPIASTDEQSAHHALATELLAGSTELLDEQDMLSLEDDEAQPVSEDESIDDPTEEVSDEKKKDLDNKLTRIYENADGSMPDMTHFQKRPRWRLIKAFFTFLVTVGFLGVVAYAGFFVFQPQSGFSEADVILSISGDEEVQIGQEVRYRIRYRNAQSVPLTQASLQVRYPEGFVFSESSRLPSNDTNTEWELGAIDEEGSGYIDIYGTMFGDLDQERSFRVFLNYIPSNFSSPFQKVSHTTVVLNDAPVSLAVEAPEIVVAGAETSLLFDVSAVVGDVSQTGELAFVLEPHDRFVISGSSPEADELSDYTWTLSSLGEKQTIEVRGIFSAVEEETPVSLTGRLEGKINGESFVYTSETIEVPVSTADLSASLAINGSLHSFTVQPGEVLNTSIRIKNNGSIDLEKMRVRAIFDAPSFDGKSLLFWSELTDELEGAVVGEQLSDTMRRGTITWNQSNLRDLNVLAPGSDVTIDVSLPIKTKEDISLQEIVEYVTNVTLEVQYESDGELQIYTSTPLELTVNSDLDLEVRDETVSLEDGKTQHNMQWILTNSFHALSDIELTADVYGDVTVDPDAFVVPAGGVVYDEENKQITWRVETMPTSVDVLALSLPIVLNVDNPSQTNLTSQVTLRATDATTNEQILAIGDEILLRVPPPSESEE